jgi:hypothetical protein
MKAEEFSLQSHLAMDPPAIPGKSGRNALQDRVGGRVRRGVHGMSGDERFDEYSRVRQGPTRGVVRLSDTFVAKKLHDLFLDRTYPFPQGNLKTSGGQEIESAA